MCVRGCMRVCECARAACVCVCVGAGGGEEGDV